MLRRYQTVNVFTRTRFSGNPLAVVLDADGLSDQQMQAIACEFNYSETSFVCRPRDPDNTAHVRIFTPTVEVPFAGHPNVGTAHVLATLADADPQQTHYVFEEQAGLVRVRLVREGSLFAAQITVPQPLTIGSHFWPDDIAACLRLQPIEIEERSHPPLIASVGLPFVVAELTSRYALRRCRLNVAAFDSLLSTREADAIYVYTRDVGPRDGPVDFTARMFAPFDNLPEDPATGSATAAVTALRAAISPSRQGRQRFIFAQGVDMGRHSLIHAEVDITGTIVGLPRIAGTCVPVMNGVLYA
jgi:trans-2,3-dihydro-3-hydroxyanthranilate isomerase